MSLRVVLRIVALALFAIAPISVGTTDTLAASHTSHFLAFQDLGDDDGDGIPNFLDPDDNNDGTTDEETVVEPEPEPAEDPEPLPSDEPQTEQPPAEEEVVDEEVVVGDEGEEETPAPVQETDTGSETTTNTGASAPSTSAPQPAQVTSLPDTGFGTAAISTLEVPFILSSILLLGVGAYVARIGTRVR